MSLCVRMEYVRVQEDVMWFNELAQKIPLNGENGDNNVWLFVSHVKFFFFEKIELSLMYCGVGF